MTVIYVFEMFKRMVFVRVTKHGTVRTDRLGTRVAVITQRGLLMLGTHFFFICTSSKNGSWVTGFSVASLLDMHLSNGSRELIHKSAINKLSSSEPSSAVGALRSVLSDPPLHTVVAGQFGAAWTHDGISHTAVANETLEYFSHVILSARWHDWACRRTLFIFLMAGICRHIGYYIFFLLLVLVLYSIHDLLLRLPVVLSKH
jgi:hypothetical protein